MQYDMESIQTFTELLNRCKQYEVICIHGKSATGKTTIAAKLRWALGIPVYHTDDYQKLGFEQALYGLMHALEEREKRACIIEGIQVPRLIRKGFKPDFIVEIVCDEALRVRRYHQRGDGNKVKNLAKFDAVLGKIWRECNIVCPQVRYSTDL